jgi:Gpi18-like mannosyltransferase
MQVSTDPSDNIHSTVSTRDDTANSEGINSELSLEAARPISGRIPPPIKTFWQNWSPALRNVLPIYVVIHLGILVINCLAFLFVVPDSSPQILPVATLWQQWHYWDTAHFINIAQHGYTGLYQMAFFPLYPLLERGAMTVTQDPLLAGLLISNIAELVMFVALYRLIEEDFNGERAYYGVLYFAIFPSAFFFSAAFTESLFLSLAILSFYNIRRGRWWPAALFGFLASLTRPDGLYLLVPFCYEYFRRIWQQQGESPLSIFPRDQIIRLLKGTRFNILIGLCLPAGIVLFMGYGYYQFHDPLAFVHAHAYWNRSLHFPGWNMVQAMLVIVHHRFVSFLAMRSAIDLGANLFVLVLILSMFIGPWKLPKTLWSYGFYAATIYLYFQLFPRADGLLPLESMARFLLEIFPAFIMLARISKHRTLNMCYCIVSGALFFFLLTQFLTGHWVP